MAGKKKKPAPKSGAERVAALRARQEKSEIVRVEVKVHKSKVEALRRIAATMQDPD